MTHETPTSYQRIESYNIALFEALPGSCILLQNNAPHFTVLAATPEYLAQTGYRKEAIIGKGIFEMSPANPDDPTDTGAHDLKESLEHVTVYKEPHHLPVQRYDIAGENGAFSERYWRASNKPVCLGNGELAYIIHAAEDITSEIQAEKREVQIEGIEKVFGLFMHAPMVVSLVDGDDYRLEMANEEAFKLWGKGNEVLGKPILEVMPELKEQGILERFDQVRTSELPFIAHEVPVTSIIDGKEKQHYFNLVYQPYFSEINAKASGVFTISHDVTEQVKARQKAQEDEAKYRSLFDFMVQGYCTIEILCNPEDKCIDYRYVEINPAFERQSGLYNAVGKTIRELAPDIESYWFDFFGNIAQSGQPDRIIDESRALGKWFEIYAVRIGGHGSKKVGVFFTDVTEVKQSEVALKKSESNLRNTILQAPVAMAILKGPTFILDIANDAMYELWGRGKEELQNISIFEGLPEAKNQGFEELLNGVFTTGERFSAQGIPITLPRNGEVKTVYVNLLYEAFREADNSISGVIAVAIDVTEQVVAQMKIEESNKDFQFVSDFMPQMIWVTRPDGYHYYYNKQWYDFTGLTAGETEGEGWNAVFHPEDRERAWKLWRHSLDTGDPYEIEYRCRRYDGEYRWVLGRALPLKDEAGTILKWFGTCTVIHDQKIEAQLLEQKVQERTVELQLAIQELKRSNAHLEEFTHAASHDLKEPVRKIHFFIKQLKDQLSTHLGEAQAKAFNRIENATERMGNLIDDLLLYSHVSQRPHEMEEVDLNQKLQRVLEDLELDIADKGATIEVNKLPVVKGFPRQLQQLFQNLISNGLKYSRANVPAHISINGKEVTENDRSYYELTVQDNGIGFEAKYTDRIFQIFTRLHGKAEYTGTGVGLAIVKKVVENHEGMIRVESVTGEGSTFSIYLPILQQQAFQRDDPTALRQYS